MDELLCVIQVGKLLSPPNALAYYSMVANLKALSLPDTAVQNSGGNGGANWTSFGGLVSVKRQLIKALQWAMKYE